MSARSRPSLPRARPWPSRRTAHDDVGGHAAPGLGPERRAPRALDLANTEASIGVTQWLGLTGFGLGGVLLAPAAAPSRRIEVVGDSLSVGAGVEGDAACPGGIDAYTTTTWPTARFAARAVAADVSTIAWSGIGV